MSPASSMSHRETRPLTHVCSQDSLQTPVLLFHHGVRNWGQDMMAGQVWGPPDPTPVLLFHQGVGNRGQDVMARQVWGPPDPTQRRYGGAFT